MPPGQRYNLVPESSVKVCSQKPQAGDMLLDYSSTFSQEECFVSINMAAAAFKTAAFHFKNLQQNTK